MKNLDNITKLELQEKVDLFHTKLLEKLKGNALPANVFKWLKGVVNFLESKTFIASNIDDVLWFYSNGLFKDKRIMDFGAGGGYITYLLSHKNNKVKAYEYKGDWTDQEFDKNEYIVAFSFAQKIVNEIDGKIQFNFYKSLPLNEENEIYDGVVLYAVIEHIDPAIESRVFKELYRILKPGGSLYIAKLPRLFSYQEFIARKLKLGNHSNLFTKKKINKLLNKYGFKIVKIEKTDMFFNHPNQITNLLFPVTSRLEKVLKHTPLSFFSHNYRLIAQKSKDIKTP